MPIVRRLGSWENYFAEFHQKYIHAILVYYVHVKSRVVIDVNHTKQTLQRLQQRFQALTLTITSIEETPPGTNLPLKVRYFSEVPDKEVACDLLPKMDWRKAVEDEEGKRFEEGDLLWRVCQLQQEEIEDGYSCPFLFTFHHSAVDGRSVVSGVLDAFIHLLDDVICDRPIEVGQRWALPPPVEELDFRHPVGDQSEEGLSQLKVEATTKEVEVDLLGDKEVLSERYETHQASSKLAGADGCKRLGEEVHSLDAILKKFCGVHGTSSLEPVTGIVDIGFNVAETKNILHSCKQHGVSLTGYFAAVTAEALVKTCSNRGFKIGCFEANVRCTVDVRPHTTDNVDCNNLGLLFQACSPKVHIRESIAQNGREFWDLAKSYHEDLHLMISNGEHLKNVHALEDENSMVHQRDRFSLKPCVKGYLALSNLGNFDISVDELCPTVTLDEVFFVSSFTFLNTNPFHQKMVTINGKCFWSLTYSKMLVDERLAREYSAFIKEVATSHCSRATSMSGI